MKQILDDIGTGYDLVLDPYMGSGSTLIACEILKRRCYAMEIAPEYVDLAVKRWEDFTGQKATGSGNAMARKQRTIPRAPSRKRKASARPVPPRPKGEAQRVLCAACRP